MTLPTPARGLVLLLAFTFMQAGPLLRTGFGRDLPPWLHAWRMYHSRGHEQCRMSTYDLPPDGAPVEVDWIEELGEGPWYVAPRRHLEITSHDDARKVAKRLCKGRREGHGVSVVTSCLDRPSRRWVATETVADDLCGRGEVR